MSRTVDPEGVRMVQWVHDGVTPFTPTRTGSGTPLHWSGSCVFLRPQSAELADVPGGLVAAVESAAAAWEDATRACGFLRLEVEMAEVGLVGLDHVNRIIAREETWCRPATAMSPEKCYDEGAIAITTLFWVDKPGDPDDGVIVDADIELNAVNFALATCDGQANGCTSNGTGLRQDLAALLTHEIGHVLGLDHTCFGNAGGEPPLDGNGQPIPSCFPASSPAPEVTEATMYNFQAPEEIKKRTPEADDVVGFCARYPIALDPGVCAPVGAGDEDSGGCATTLASDAALAVLIAAALVCRRRRPRRR